MASSIFKPAVVYWTFPVLQIFFLLSGESFFQGLQMISQTHLNNHPILRLIVPYTQENEIYSIISLGKYTRAWKSWTMLKVSLSLYPNTFSVLLHSFGEFQHIYIRSLKLSYSSLMSCSFFSLFSVNFQLFLLPCNQVNSEKAMATHSSALAWKIPWTEEPGRLQSMGSQRVGHDWATSTFTFHFHALEKETATHSSVLAWRIPGTEEPSELPSMGSHRVGHNRSDLSEAAATKLTILFYHG